MTSPPVCLEQYFAAWNAHDGSVRRRHLEAAVSADLRYLDPHRTAQGIDAFARSLSEFRMQSPQAIVEWASGVDAHHDLYRYAWRLVDGGRTVVEGQDVVELDGSGRLRTVLSFFGSLPPLAG